jgi:hypothetical protein
MAHSRRRYAGAVALSVALAACLATPHPTSGGTSDGAAIPGDAGNSCAAMAIDTFAAVPSGCNGTVAGGTLQLATPMTTTNWCDWHVPLGKAVIVHIESVALGTGATGEGFGYLALGFTNPQEAMVAFRYASSGVYTLYVNTMMQPQTGLGSDAWVLLEASSLSSVTARYSPTYTGNLAAWTQLESVGITGSTSDPPTITLGVSSMAQGSAYASFTMFEFCP